MEYKSDDNECITCAIGSKVISDNICVSSCINNNKYINENNQICID